MPLKFNKQIAIPAIVGVSILSLAVISFVYTNNQQQAPEQTVTPPQANNQKEEALDPSTPATESSREEVSPFLTNLKVLSSVYTDIEYFFINQTAMEFATQEFNEVESFAIDPVSFGQRSDGNYSFAVVDGVAGTRLFYVIIFRNSDGGITVEQYL